MALSEKRKKAFAEFIVWAIFMVLLIAGLISLVVGLNLRYHEQPLPTSFCSSNAQRALIQSIRALCAHLNDMWNLGLALIVIGIVVFFLSAVVARALHDIGTRSTKSLSMEPARKNSTV
jgi:uncharacterized membrane protein YhaH (DUF805 family)